MSDSLLTASEVAQFLKLNVETVYALIAKEGLPALKVGGQWRFEKARLQMWLERQYAPCGESRPEPPLDGSEAVKPNIAGESTVSGE